MNSVSKTFENIMSFSKNTSHWVCGNIFALLLIILIISSAMFVMFLFASIFTSGGSCPHIISSEEVNRETKKIDMWCRNLKSVPPTHICERFIALDNDIYCSVPCEYSGDHFSELSCERDCKKLFKSKNSYLAIHTFQIDLLYIIGISFSLGMGIFIYYYSYE